MDTMFENLDFRFDKENNDERPFMIACKDREIMDGGTLGAGIFIDR